MILFNLLKLDESIFFYWIISYIINLRFIDNF